MTNNNRLKKIENYIKMLEMLKQQKLYIYTYI